MRFEELQTGLFGYRKYSVYRLIVSMEEKFSAELLEKDAQNARAMEEAQAKISALEEELKTLQAEHRAQHEQKSLISRVLMEAQIHAQELRDETQAQEEQLRGQLQEQARMQKAELEEYAEKLSRLRASFQILLENMDNQAEKLEQQVEELAEAVPTPGSRLPLFPNKTGTED